jgi:DNA repair protein RadA
LFNYDISTTARQSTGSGGIDTGVIYIDTEGTFRPERVEQIAKAKGLDYIQVLRSVSVCLAVDIVLDHRLK